MQTTDTKSLHDAFVTAIRGITPRFAYLSSQTWHHQPTARDTELEGAPLRNFFIRFYPSTPSYLWKGGVGAAYVCRMVVTVSYADVDPGSRDHMISEDGVDLRRALEQLRDPTHPGFVNLEAPAPASIRFDNGTNAVVDFPYVVHYHQATA